MKLLIFGATGACGKHVAQKALENSHEVTVFARNPSKLPQELASHVKVIRGNLSDESSFRTAVQDQDAIISTLGPTGISGYTSFSAYHAVFPTFYKLLLRLMREHGVRRILAMSTFSLYDPKDKRIVSRAALVWLVWLLAGGAWREFVELGDTFEKNGEGIDWTMYRVAVITDAPESVARAGFVGEKGFKLTIRRKDMATWLIEQAETKPPQWIRQAPAISSIGKGEL